MKRPTEMQAKIDAPAKTAGGGQASAKADPRLGQATAELKGQHPMQHYDHGPHHGTDHHKRHSPVDMRKVKC